MSAYQIWSTSADAEGEHRQALQGYDTMGKHHCMLASAEYNVHNIHDDSY